MSVHIIALDGHDVVTRPSAEQLSSWAYEARAADCRQCTSSDTWCATGRRPLTAIAPRTHDDLPGYLNGDATYPSI